MDIDNITIKNEKKLKRLKSFNRKSALKNVKFLQNEFGLDESSITKMLSVAPDILKLSQENIKAKAKFYQDEFALSKDQFVKMIINSPMLLGYNQETVLRKSEFYQSKLSVTFQIQLKVRRFLHNFILFVIIQHFC